MAERFGGKYSPGSTESGDDAKGQAVRAARAEEREIAGATTRAGVLFAPPVLLVVMSLNNGATVLITALIAAVILGLGAWLTREGLRAEAEYNSRTVARRPALPRKMLGAGLTGVGIAVAALTGTSGLVAAVLYGIVAAVLHLGAFGLDPLRDKRMEGIDTFQQDRVARVVDEAEDHLAAIKDHIAKLGDRTLSTRIEGFTAVARQMIRTVEEDPRDLTAARKYLGVYLLGARDATVKFSDLYARDRATDLRSDYEALLADLETNFAARTEQLLESDRTDMDIEIKVLRDRLDREGVTPH